MQNDPLSPELLQAIWNQHGLGRIEHLYQPTGGMVNRCWIINDQHVIRFDVLDDWGEINRYAGEKWAYETLATTDVPVPQVHVLDDSRQFAPYPYMILSKSPGTTIARNVTQLSTEEQRQIAYCAGEYLATIHSYEVDGFGLLFKIMAGKPKPSWLDYVTSFYQGYGNQAVEAGTLEPDVLRRVFAIMERMQPLLKSVQRGRFIHGDYHFANLLQHQGKLSAVLDFEWALSGDPSWDFRIDNQLEEECPGSREAFYAGYTSRRTLPEQHPQRVSFYRMGSYIDWLATFAPDDANELAYATPLLLHEIAWLEANL